MARPETPGIFISYRRDDARADAGRLCDRLKGRFGDEQVFMDIDDLKPGQKFVDELNRTLDGCDILIVLIGSGWVDARDDNGSPRLMDEQDFVRREVLTALQRGIEIIPVLVNRTPMPTVESLPPALAPLAGYQAIEISDSRFHQDVDRLVEILDGNAGTHAAWAPRRVKWGAAGAIVLVAAVLLWSGLFQWPWVSNRVAAGHSDQSSADIVTLRSEPTTLSSAEVKAMLVQKNFFDASWFPSGSGPAHDYEVKVLGGDLVVADRGTNLMWQQGESGRPGPFDSADEYIQALNEGSYGGHGNWRLPTLEEAMSLLSPEMIGDAHISALFSWRDTPIMWTADRAGEEGYWVVYPHDGIGRPERRGFNAWVRAVRTLE